MFIELSGIDGSGKTTQVDLLARWAQEAKVPCYERPLRSTVRRVISGIAAGMGHDSWRDVFDRNAVELATALEAHQLAFATIEAIKFPGQVIVSDTYARTLLAVAIAEGGADIAQLRLVLSAMPQPDLAIHLTVPVDVAFDRILARPKGDHLLRTGGRARLERLANAFESAELAANEFRAHVVDGGLEVHEVHGALRELILAGAGTEPALRTRLSSGKVSS